MEVDAFRHIVDTMEDHLNVLYFYFMGEPFLVKNAYDMVEYASRKQIWVDTCTNGEFIDAQSLMDSGIGRVSFQIGGMTQQTHEIYRVRGDLEKSLRNLEACVEEKKRRPDCRTQLKVGFIVMRHNEHEVDAFQRYAEDIGVDDYEIVHPCARNMQQANQFLTEDPAYWIYDLDAFDRGILRPAELSNQYCEWLYFTTTIQVNGDVVPCCRDPRGRYVLGNIFNQDFVSEIWNGPAYCDFRHTVATKQSEAEICSLCSGYTAPDVTRHSNVIIPEAATPASTKISELPVAL
jgi:radical SAM protein with 4Fe4S-binding SPASM domain